MILIIHYRHFIIVLQPSEPGLVPCVLTMNWQILEGLEMANNNSCIYHSMYNECNSVLLYMSYRNESPYNRRKFYFKSYFHLVLLFTEASKRFNSKSFSPQYLLIFLYRIKVFLPFEFNFLYKIVIHVTHISCNW